MKKQLYIFLNLFFVSLFIPALCSMETSSHFNEHAKTSFITSIKNLAYKTPFFACWRTNLAQKEAAQEIIKNLLFEKAQLKAKLHSPNIDPEEKEAIAATITEINKQIHEQKVITGEKWSNTRNFAWKSIKIGTCIISGIVIVALINNTLYKQLLHTKTELTVTKNTFNKKYTTLKKKYTTLNKKYKKLAKINIDMKEEALDEINKQKEKIKNLTEQIIDLSQEIEKYWKIRRDLIIFQSYLDKCSNCKQSFQSYLDKCSTCKRVFAQLSKTINDTIYKKNNKKIK